MTLSEKQQQFARMVFMLLAFVNTKNGYEVTFAQAYRSPERAAEKARLGTGISNSLHCKRLAIDLNLFVRGVYQTTTAAHKPLGKFWKSLGGSWGGDFTKPDGNHYSLKHNGVR
jgi:hypothetical protein